MDLVKELKQIVGSNVLVAPADVEKFVRDESPFHGSTPIAVVTPANTSQISRIMELCSKNGTNVTVRGGGTSLTGSSVPKANSIVIDMSRFNKILEVHIEDRYAVVEPDVKIDQLNKFLSKYNYFYPPDPGSSSIATVGGTISTNAGGLRAVKYGTTKEWVLGLEVVLPDGKIIHTGEKTLKRSIGYDLTALMVASEGTLGIITKAVLAIWPKPEATSMVTAYFSNIEDAGKAIGMLKRKGITPLAAEFIDKASMQLMKQTRHISFPSSANYMLFIELGTTKESVQRLTALVESIMDSSKAFDISKAVSEKSISRLYEARKYLFLASLHKANRSKRNLMIADIVVPASDLPASLHEMQKVISSSKLEVVMFGHIGDGNIHANILYKDEKKERSRVDKLQNELGMIAIKHHGSVSGEHGIGLMKKDLLKEEFKARNTLDNIALMKGIKQVFDPKGILNKGKIFD